MRCVLFLFLCVIFYPVFSQEAENLVPNPGFEDYQPGNNPYGSSKGFVPKYWYSPTDGTSDFFIKWSRREGDMDNWAGFKLARTGDCYMGLMTRYVFSYSASGNTREYITTKLKRPLVKNQKYEVTFYVQLGQNCLYATDGLAAYLSKNKPDSSNYDGSLNVEPQITAVDQGIFKNTQRWKKISGVFTSKGGEEYLTIGNFMDNFNTQWEEIENVGKYNIYLFAYYFIDDVSVISVNYFENDLALGASNILKNIFFKKGEAELLAGSIDELNKLLKLMREYPSLEIEIAGHTDKVGTETSNVQLSTRRAKAVSDYLMSEGIEKRRIRFKGYGSSRPIDDNETEEGREKNRRVEFVVLKL
jgi:outer membrane protein OmpA-like peptidoglycan-associated protein